MSIAANLKNLKSEIEALSALNNNFSTKTELIAVSKQHNAASIEAAINAGQRIFAENRVQEALQKWPDLKLRYPDIELHLIGHLQTNKAKDAVKFFDVIESLDSKKLADALLSNMQKLQRFIPCYIQVNIGNEPQKSGISPDLTPDFIKYCLNIGLKIDGLMCIPPDVDDPTIFFESLKKLATANNIKNLSMGMSQDYRIAIKCGATHVRIGTGVFGER